MRRIPILLILTASVASADEGMWTPDNFPSDMVKEKYDVEIDQAWLDHARLSTVRLSTPSGGCTGSFVSPNGLILTNRHCVDACVSEHTSEEYNAWQEGFYAKHPGEELRCSATHVEYLHDLEDVTTTVHEAARGLGEIEANKVRKQTLTRLEQDCEEAAQGALKCEVVALYNGGQYFLYAYKRHDDIRLVFSPDIEIGEFGGDPDNFSFPRWTLDMSFLRAYDKGQPIASPSHLRWRAAGADLGEAVFITGHPGSTQRQLTVAQYEFLRNVTLPNWLLRYVELRGRYRQFASQDEEAYRIVQDKLKLIENSIKVRRNELHALLDDDQMERKKRQEAELREAVTSDSELASTVYAWHQIETAQQAYLTFLEPYILVEGRGGLQGRLLGFGRILVRAAEERDKPNGKRLRGYTESSLPGLEQFVLSGAPVHARVEELEIAFGLEKLQEWLGHDDPLVRKTLGNESPRSMAARLVRDTGLFDPEVRRKLWDGGSKAIRKSKDPVIRLMRALEADSRALLERYQDEYQAPIAEAQERLAAARFAVHGTSVYPDATFTFRISYGDVRGWEENGKNVTPFTTLGKAFARATGELPFALSQKWLDAMPKLEMDTRFNYVSTLDITGGNSGSPVIDAEGNVVGLAFDGNRHSISGSYWYDIDKNRAIAVHPAIMLEALEKVYGADRILAELEFADRTD
ncbi:MAG: S46 family peptidase [Gammaproteobacteria bacterium]|nr:MAG: S46 family peptidase [Gammaproteobacteria bacterium]